MVALCRATEQRLLQSSLRTKTATEHHCLCCNDDCYRASLLPLNRKLKYRLLCSAPFHYTENLTTAFCEPPPFPPKCKVKTCHYFFLSDHKMAHVCNSKFSWLICSCPPFPQCKVDVVASILFFVRARRLSRQHCNFLGERGASKSGG